MVLLDEIEKAHRQVCNVLLQVSVDARSHPRTLANAHTHLPPRIDQTPLGLRLSRLLITRPTTNPGSLSASLVSCVLDSFDEGHLTDGQGRRVDFRNTIIIATSNLGADLMRTVGSGEWDRLESLMKEAARQHFPPEFINRLDDLVTFRPLAPDVMPAIVDIQVAQVCKLLLDQQVQLDIRPAAKRWLGLRGYDVEYGARPLKRVIYNELLTPLAKRILAGDIKAHGQVVVDVQRDNGNELTLTYTPPVDPNAPSVQPIEPLLEPEDDEELAARHTQQQQQQAAASGPASGSLPGTTTTPLSSASSGARL